MEESTYQGSNKTRRIYFLNPTYGIGGGEALYMRIMEYMMNFRGMKFGIIDFPDGTMTRSCKKFFNTKDIDYIDYNSYQWKMEDNSVIFGAEDIITAIKKVVAKNVKISILLWETGVGWNILFDRKTLKKYAKLLYTTSSLSFTDYGCWVAGCQQLHQNFNKHYITLPFYFENTNYSKKRPDTEINLAWLGRLTGVKTFSLMNAIENFYKYKTSKKKNFHIIGNGFDEKFLKEYVKQYSHEINFYFTGILTGDSLKKYIQENIDVGVAIGTSLLHFAALKIPAMGIRNGTEPFFNNRFIWLFNEYEYSTGLPPVTSKGFDELEKRADYFDNMLDDIVLHKKGKEYGELSYKYYNENHVIEITCKHFEDVINKTTLTYEEWVKMIKFIPYQGEQGISIHTIKFLLPFKVVYHEDKQYFYCCGLKFLTIQKSPQKFVLDVFGLRILKKVSTNGNYKLKILGIPIIKAKWWGRYNWPQFMDPSLKEVTKNNYPIDKLMYSRQKTK